MVDAAVRVCDAGLLGEEIGRSIDKLIEDNFALYGVAPRVRRAGKTPARLRRISTFALRNEIGATAAAPEDEIDVSGTTACDDRELGTIKYPRGALGPLQLVSPPEYGIVETVPVRVENLAKAR
jgi:hypothetical protein